MTQWGERSEKAANAVFVENHEQKAALAASNGREGWISWRELRRWYALWEAPQLMRRAPAVSQTRGALPRALVPFASLQADCMDMGSWARPAGAAWTPRRRPTSGQRCVFSGPTSL